MGAPLPTMAAKPMLGTTLVWGVLPVSTLAASPAEPHPKSTLPASSLVG
ncbi:hypothetical protein PR003_g26931 [Phytophthora rubi]|uniref:RxLR effector protein n=1 Tax=Phytophthora rubi TaxID=129364 RepID=A0A6A4C557_9STRA|nr:hypothetical protein PR003_g26931 [Phytophthora rubi]